jgi:HTH-type transcriptional regulator/antitoxin HigA
MTTSTLAAGADVHSDLAIPPGEFLEEVIADLDMTKDELARRMQRPPAKLSAVFKGEKAITPETALQLEKVVGVPAHIWLGLESEYRLTLARSQARQSASLGQEEQLTTGYCYAQLAKLGMVANSRKPLVRVAELQRFFGVASLLAIPEVRLYEAALRQSPYGVRRRSPLALTAWLRLGELKAREVDCGPFDPALLSGSLEEIRRMTLEAPQSFQAPLQRMLAKAGVALVICPHFPRTGVHGATFWQGRKGVLLITIRGAWAHVFWFSLFHELGHLSLHSRRGVIFEYVAADAESRKREEEADDFAAETLVPSRDYLQFVEAGDLTEQAIRRLASSLGIDPGIVVGRLQHDGHVKHDRHNGLRSRFRWVEEE